MDINALANVLAKSGTASLFFKEGSSDKVYHVDLVKNGTAYDVVFRYGRRGGTLNIGNKNTSPITLNAAETMMVKLLKEKLGKGYEPSDTDGGHVCVDRVALEVSQSAFSPQLLNPIDKYDLKYYLSNSNWVMQEKKDGERRMIVLNANGAKGINRKGNYLELPGKLVKSLLSNYKMKDQTVLDGEIIGDEFFPFDVLMLDGVDLTVHDYAHRLRVMLPLLAELKLKYPEAWYTFQDKVDTLAELKNKLAEGVVFKALVAPYTAGRPNSGGTALKYKFVETCTVQAGEVKKDKRSVAMYVYGKNGMRHVGYVTVLPNFNIPNDGDLIEVQYLYYYEDGSLYQPVFKGFRTDLATADHIDTLKRKGNYNA